MKILLAALCSVFLIGCTSSPSDSSSDEKLAEFLSQQGFEEKEQTERIVNFTIDSWKYVDPFHIVIETKPKASYLVSLRIPCHELRSALVIGTSGTAGSLTKFDKIIYKDNFSGRQECPIRNIVKLESVSSNAGDNEQKS